MRRVCLLILLSIAGFLPSAAPAAAADCRFILGFKTLHADLPLTIGSCVDNQAFAANGDALQHTTHGLLVWRKADNFTAFTDGYHTWINGPTGLDLRLNSQRFAWEADAGAPGTTRLATSFAHVPSLAAVKAVMARTVEVHLPSEHFVPLLPPVTIADGDMGTLTAALGGRFPTADGYGQLTFFWHGTTFLGWDVNHESSSIRGLSSPAAGIFSVTYTHYAPTDALCCPSLGTVTIDYTWNGSRLVPSGRPPSGNTPIPVMLAGS